MNKKKKPWWNADMTLEERLAARLPAQQWKERWNKIILAKQHFELMESQDSERQSKNAKLKTGTTAWLAKTTEEIYKFNEPETFDEFLDYLIDDEHVTTEQDDFITSITYRLKRSKPKTVKRKTLQNIFSNLRKTFPY